MNLYISIIVVGIQLFSFLSHGATQEELTSTTTPSTHTNLLIPMEDQISTTSAATSCDDDTTSHSDEKMVALEQKVMLLESHLKSQEQIIELLQSRLQAFLILPQLTHQNPFKKLICEKIITLSGCSLDDTGSCEQIINHIKNPEWAIWRHQKDFGYQYNSPKMTSSSHIEYLSHLSNLVESIIERSGIIENVSPLVKRWMDSRSICLCFDLFFIRDFNDRNFFNFIRTGLSPLLDLLEKPTQFDEFMKICLPRDKLITIDRNELWTLFKIISTCQKFHSKFPFPVSNIPYVIDGMEKVGFFSKPHLQIFNISDNILSKIQKFMIQGLQGCGITYIFSQLIIDGLVMMDMPYFSDGRTKTRKILDTSFQSNMFEILEVFSNLDILKEKYTWEKTMLCLTSKFSSKNRKPADASEELMFFTKIASFVKEKELSDSQKAILVSIAYSEYKKGKTIDEIIRTTLTTHNSHSLDEIAQKLN